MGHKENESSESDEETKVRHDRFRSERFQSSSGNSTGTTRPREERYDKYGSRTFRSRSPSRSHRDRVKSSSRDDSRKSNSKSRYSDKVYHSKSSRSNKDEIKNHKLIHDKKGSDKHESENKTLSKTNPKKLSSLLIDFDKSVESRRNSESQLQIGPSLPPHLAVKMREESESSSSQSQPEIFGPELPPHSKNPSQDSCNKSNDTALNVVSPGSVSESSSRSKETDETCPHEPSLEAGSSSPANLHKQIISNDDSSRSTTHDVKQNIVAELNSFDAPDPPNTPVGVYGPALPPKLETNSYGPALPPSLKKVNVQGPTLPSGMTVDDLEKMEQDESEDEDTVGPLPEGKMNMTQYQLDLRAMEIKRKLEEEKSGPSIDVKKREEWMLELPPEKASNLGLGPRSFRMKEAPDMSNRSSWTDTPADKKRKEEMAMKGETEQLSSEDMMKSAFVAERNETMDRISQLSRDESRQKSLLELHQKKLKKKKKKEDKEGKKKERRPFDRNIDLQVNRFDEAQKKAIFKKAQLLDTRFSTGESKYL